MKIKIEMIVLLGAMSFVISLCAVNEVRHFKGIKSSKKAKTITLGTTAPLSGSLYKLGRDFTKGMRIVFKEINRRKGIHGYHINQIIRDDQYEPSKIRRNIDKLLRKTSILFGTFSSDALLAIPTDKLDDYLVIFPNSGVSKFRDPRRKTFFFFRPSIKEEVETLVTYIVEKLFRRKIAIFHEDSAWGENGAKLAKEYISTLSDRGIQCVAMASHVRNSVNVREAVEEISRKSPEVVLCIAHYRPTYSFIRGMLNKGEQSTTFCGVSETALMQNYLKKSRGVDLITSSVVPNPWKSELPIAKSFRAAMKKHLPNYALSVMSFEGYIIGKFFEKVFLGIAPPFTLEKIVSALESFKGEVLGLKLVLDPATRSFSKNIWINEHRDKDWMIFKRRGDNAKKK